MTTTELEAIEARAADATPGPWWWGAGRSEVLCSDGILADHKHIFVNCGRGSGDPEPEDAEFIAHARTDIPALVAEVRRLQAIVVAVDEALTLNWIGVKDEDYRQALHDLVTREIATHDDPVVSEVAQARQDELRKLRADNAELRRDRDRLDWELSGGAVGDQHLGEASDGTK
ncbi:MAG TPA: hypothetical protein VM120_25200 [Bryobacteraceae bacterium]|nr:hypothetical protein [Bryobacteraceae bacterium]